MPNRRDPEAPGRGGGAEEAASRRGADEAASRPDGVRFGAASGGVPPASVPPELRDLPWELPHTFLGLDEEASAWDAARAVIVPVPYESTTSYGGGTREGPRAVLEASRYVELYDHELDAEPASVGVHTLPALELTRAGAAAAMEELEAAAERILEVAGDRFPIFLGGEHAVTPPLVRAVARRSGGRISVLQLDAHADLRPSYEGSADSHASAMAGVLDVADVVGVGIRAVSAEEVERSRASDASTLVWAEEMAEDDAWMDRALRALGDPVYLTFDVDYFDPSLVPSTGTPEPGGGTWHPTLRFLRRVFRERTVLAADVVELAPLPGLHAPDFLVARLVYKLIGYRFHRD